MKKKWIQKLKLRNYQRNEMYIQEISHFITCVKNKKTTINPINDGLKTLKIALAVKKSSILKKVIKIKN